jgi:polyferredoxin
MLVSLLAWLLGQTVGPNRAGRLVTVPEDAMETGVARTLLAHWVLWAAVALILLALSAGYVRRRWRRARQPGTVRLGRGRPDQRK